MSRSSPLEFVGKLFRRDNSTSPNSFEYEKEFTEAGFSLFGFIHRAREYLDTDDEAEFAKQWVKKEMIPILQTPEGNYVLGAIRRLEDLKIPDLKRRYPYERHQKVLRAIIKFAVDSVLYPDPDEPVKPGDDVGPVDRESKQKWLAAANVATYEELRDFLVEYIYSRDAG